MSMTASKSDFGTAPQHQFSKSRWSQHSENALKVWMDCVVLITVKSYIVAGHLTWGSVVTVA